LQTGKIHGENTDGKGALNALEKTGSVSDKKVLIIGAGGSAKAIAYEAEKRGAKTQTLSRTLRQNSIPISQFSECDYDILINCTPSDLPVEPHLLREGKIVMDIRVNPQDSSLLSEAQKRGCCLVGWKEMFYEQAKLQLELFLSSQ
jgi:3-dehydroquinate dehydratase/shikimate dehydrogenase